MTRRSTVILSLITLLALGGCNAPSGSNSSSSNEANTTPPEKLAETSTTNSTTPDQSGTTPPAQVSQPLPPSTSETTESEPSATSSSPSSSVDQATVAQSPSTQSNTVKPDSISSNSNSNGDNPNAGVTVQSASAKMSDTSIVPGEKVGVVTGTTTYADLENTFGSDRLTTEEIHLGEGMMAPSTQVVLDDGYSFNIVWADESQSKPLEVRDLDTGWNVQGIYNGMSFADLQAALGEFELLGLGWDYGGTLLLENTPLADHSGKLFIRVQPSEKAVETQQEKFLAVAGDSAFPSSDPNFSDLDLSVVEVVVRLD